MLQAKTVIPNQYWILRDDQGKVGNIEATAQGVRIRIRNRVETYEDLTGLTKRVKIHFHTHNQLGPKTDSMPCEVNGYPTVGPAHNGLFDVKHQVPLWTREPRSKSWYAAGWYALRRGRRWQVTQCPKLIALERYTYQGPFHTREEAEHAAAHQ